MEPQSRVVEDFEDRYGLDLPAERINSVTESNLRGQCPLYSFHSCHASLRHLLHHHQKYYSDLPLLWCQIGARSRICTDLV